MAIILSLETSTDVCSVALHHNGLLIEQKIIREPQAHAAKLAPLIEDLVKISKFTFSDLNAVAVSSGPGSYTGLRIGTSTAKGICFAKNIPLIAVPTLEVLACAAVDRISNDDLICAMLDARRMEVYEQVYSKSLIPVSQVEAKVIESDSFSELLIGRKVFFVGNGAEKCKPVINHPNAFFVDDIIPLASVLGSLAEKRFAIGKFEDLSAFEPFYLKQFEAKKAKSLLQ